MSAEQPDRAAEKSSDEGAAPAPSAAAPPLTFGGAVRRLGPTGPLALIALTLPAIGGFVLLGSLDVVGPQLRDMGPAGVALYVAAFAVFSGFALLPTYAQAVLGGWAFGFAIGYPAAMAGFLGGAIIGYVVAALSSGTRVMDLIRERPAWAAVHQALVGSGPWRTLGIIALVRMPPNSPFAFVNLLTGSTRVAFIPYVVGTLLGMAPRTAAYVYIAVGVQDLLTARTATPRWMIVAGIVGMIAVFFILYAISKRAIERVTGAERDPDEPEDALEA